VLIDGLLQDASQRKIRFTSTHSPKDLFDKIENVVTEMGFQVQRGNSKLKVMKNGRGSKNLRNPSSFLVCTEVKCHSTLLSCAMYIQEGLHISWYLHHHS
jgi:hypothetical protein